MADVDGTGNGEHLISSKSGKEAPGTMKIVYMAAIHSLACVVSDLGDLPKFCSENFQKQKTNKQGKQW